MTETPPTRYVIRTRVTDVFERKQDCWVSGVGKDAVFSTKNLGWYILLDGSHEAIFLDTIRPDLAVGDIVEITIQKERR